MTVRRHRHRPPRAHRGHRRAARLAVRPPAACRAPGWTPHGTRLRAARALHVMGHAACARIARSGSAPATRPSASSLRGDAKTIVSDRGPRDAIADLSTTPGGGQAPPERDLRGERGRPRRPPPTGHRRQLRAGAYLTTTSSTPPDTGPNRAGRPPPAPAPPPTSTRAPKKLRRSPGSRHQRQHSMAAGPHDQPNATAARPDDECPRAVPQPGPRDHVLSRRRPCY